MTTVTTNTQTTPKPRTKKWTNTNSDERCLQNVGNPLSRFLYIIALKTGLYSIEPTDRRISLVMACFLTVVSTLMFYVFVQGVREGFQAAAVATNAAVDSGSSTVPQESMPSLA